jgi:GT2 family glycosyltransferase
VPEPAVSVVVATHDRPHRLARLLEALRAQDLARDAFEVIVVDDGSGPDTAAVIADHRNRDGLALRTVRNEVALGPAGARNRGWRLAEAPLIAFTDDDCTPVAGWLSAGVEAHERSPRSIIQGATDPDPKEHGLVSVLSYTVRQDRLGPSYETCNMFYPREALERLGGFDEAFGPATAGEDTDLAWRALEAGYSAAYAPEAHVFHAIERVGARGTLRRALRWSTSVRVLAEHPGSRVMLERHVFWNVWHYLLWRSLVAMLGPRWLRRLVVARHLLALHARGRTFGAGAWAVPFLLVHDGLETWAVLRGAVRYRTLVL